MTQTPESDLAARKDFAAQTQAESEPTEQVRLGKLSMEVSIALTRQETLSEMLTACTDALVRHLDAAFARIWLLNEAEGVLELQASSGLYTHLNGGHARVPVGAFKIGLIAAEREPHLTNSVLGDPRVGDQEWAKREGMISFAGYPLLIGERLVGVMAMFARHLLSEATQQEMAAIANGIALGVERLHMQQEMARLLIREQAARVEAEAAHQRMQELFMQAPAIIGVLRGKDHIFEFANPGYQQLIGHRDIIGKPVREALPEVEGQGLFELLDQVYASGEPYLGKEVKIVLDRHNDGTLEEGYFNFVYQPTRNAVGDVEGVLIHAVEVTEQVRSREEIQSSQRRLQLAQQVGHIGAFEWHIRTNRTIWTPELEALYGLPPGGFEGKYENWAQRVHPDDLQQAEASLYEAVGGGPPFHAEFRIIRPEGTSRWMLAKGEVISYDARNQPLRMVGVNIDITERKEAEQQLASLLTSMQELNTTLEAKVIERTEVLHHLNTELQRSNQELQEFAYVASHDLQEPLRKIQAFGNLLEEEYGEGLGDGKAYLDRMRNAAGRMRILIDDLLTFSRVATKAEPFTRVDLEAIMHQVIDDLEPRLEATHGTIEVGELPTIDADPRQMYQLFQNLLANALKFHRPGIPPLVRVYAEMQASGEETATTNEQYSQIFVEDNGIGFDEKYLDRIFSVFQRLHGRGDYEGTGIGLAVVRKIVGRHDGMVTARSTVGKGATFIITLPLIKNAKETDIE